ncbi:unnamed protein product [Darwinula stevensoni]|uniref:Uncharacterized protein n=1 Tax=Darwinula stevensoni TaxID=69355 RepID=A0A7R8X741_9CRUS|nr:unnamed protein product [Darwinula stevensoni]CAG0888713.1 unnamed protein product [Darwinula stevensoni]
MSIMQLNYLSPVFLLSLAFVSGTKGQGFCPDPDQTSPCTCSHDETSYSVTVDCSRATSTDEISSAFNDADWSFTNLTEFRLVNNEAIQEFPESMFGNITFEKIYVWNTAVSVVHPSSLLTSKDRLQHLSITSSRIEEFPWEILFELTSLVELDLHGNILATLPALESPSLELLVVEGNKLSALENNWKIPNLKILDIGSGNSMPPSFSLIRFLCLLVEKKYLEKRPTQKLWSGETHNKI